MSLHRSRALACTAVLLLGLAVPTAASALSIRYAFTGTITSVDPALASAFSTGQAVSVVAVIDAATVPNHPIPNTSQYVGPAVSAQFGSLSAVANPPSSAINVTDDPGIDEFRIGGAGLNLMPTVGSFGATNIGLVLTDATGTAFSSQALPTSLDLGDFASDSAQLVFQDLSAMTTAVVLADVTSVTVTVPEPRVGLLAAALLAGVALYAYRTRPA